MRNCIFCGARANSREHIWPLWLQKVVNQGRDHGTITVWRGPTDAPIQWSGPKADLKARFVCEPCNTGWMSVLETENRTIVGAMVGDFTLPLDKESQELIALWCAKTAMVLECAKPPPWFYSQSDHHGFLARFRPPPDTLVWVGRYAHHLGISSEARMLSNDATRDLPLEEGHLTNLVFGRLIMQVLTIRRRAEFHNTRFILDQRPGVPWGKYLRQVWPIRSARVTWPPPLSFSDAGETLDVLAKRFTNDR